MIIAFKKSDEAVTFSKEIRIPLNIPNNQNRYNTDYRNENRNNRMRSVKHKSDIYEVFEERHLLACDAVYPHRSSPTFRRNLLRPSSGRRLSQVNKNNKQLATRSACLTFTLALNIIHPSEAS
jgi:hypothetical protein